MRFCKLKNIKNHLFRDINYRPGENMRQKPLKSLLIMHTPKLKSKKLFSSQMIQNTE